MEQAVIDKFPALKKRSPAITRPLFAMLLKVFRQQEINDFLALHKDTTNIDFVEQVLDHFNFTYAVSARDRENIPAQGRVLIIANHPIGSLDGLALLRLVHEIRPDVKIIANDMLNAIAPLRDLLLPVDNLTGKLHRQRLINIKQALLNDMAVIMFPAGEVSRSRPNGVRDGRWRNSFLRLARETNSAVLPVFVNGRNSSLFYALSAILKPAASLLLVNEMFNKRNKTLEICIGQAIPYANLARLDLSPKETTRLVKRHLYRIGKGKKPIIATVNAIAHPEDRQLLKRSLRQGQLLGHTADNKKIFLYDYHSNSCVMREIGRLREITFRQVGEGIGERRDFDAYDRHYRHLVLWDEEELEIVGAYRIGETRQILESSGQHGLYCDSLFELHKPFIPYLNQSIELGRSFVQPRYWGHRSLDYLWYGIGAYLRHHPKIRYMYGPVSLSNNYPPAARKLLIDFYRLYFPAKEQLASAKIPYRAGDCDAPTINFSGSSYQRDFILLKDGLKMMGCTVPTLYKQYTELCHEGGVQFVDFSVDPKFGFCIDGLVLVAVDKIKDKNRQRYIERQLRVA